MGERLKKHIEQGKSVRGFERSSEESEWIDDYQLLTDKPIMYVCNVDEASAKDGNAWVEKVRVMAAEEGAGLLHLAAATEADIAELETYEERRMFLDDLGLEEPGVNRLIREAFNLLQLDTYFTAGVKEVRAWTIPRGATAPQAAGVIHSDFEKGFIRAETVAYQDFITHGGWKTAKEKGAVRSEGKEYVVQDGDVLLFRFNV